MQVIWPNQYEDIFKIKEGSKPGTSQGHNPDNTFPTPPELPKMPETNDDTIESNVITKLMEKFDEHLKSELNSHTQGIVDKVVAELEKKKIFDNQQQGSYHDSSLPKSDIDTTSPR